MGLEPRWTVTNSENLNGLVREPLRISRERISRHAVQVRRRWRAVDVAGERTKLVHRGFRNGAACRVAAAGGGRWRAERKGDCPRRPGRRPKDAREPRIRWRALPGRLAVQRA